MNKFDFISFNENCVTVQDFLSMVETGYERLIVVGSQRTYIPIVQEQENAINFEYTQQDYCVMSSTVVDIIKSCPQVKYITYHGSPITEISRKENFIILNVSR